MYPQCSVLRVFFIYTGFVLGHNSAHDPDDHRWFNWFVETGQLKAIFRTNQTSSVLARARPTSPFNDENVIVRAAGTNPWNYLDDNLVPVAHRYGWQVIWVQPTRNSDLRMLFVRCGRHLISFHRVKTRGRTAERAKHREPLKPHVASMFPEMDPPEYKTDPFLAGPIEREDHSLLCTPAQLEELVKTEDLHYWMYTYQQTKSPFFKWAVMGRPLKGEKHLLYSFDVMRAVGHILREDQIIDLNDAAQTPPNPKFGDPDDKEGNDT